MSDYVYVLCNKGYVDSDAVAEVWSNPLSLAEFLEDYMSLDHDEFRRIHLELAQAADGHVVDVDDGLEIICKAVR